MLGPLLSLLIIALAAWMLLKNMYAQAVLLLAGFVMLLLAQLLGLSTLELKKPTGLSWFDYFAFVKEAFSKTNAGVGLMIMAIGGYVAYIEKIGASDVLVNFAMKPLGVFRKWPYLAASMVIPIGQVLFIAIPSAAGLSLLLMASMFPIITRLGVSRLSAVSVITACTVFGIGPACVTTSSAVEIMEMDAIHYFVYHQLPLVWPLSILLAVLYFFVNRHFDRKLVLEEGKEAKVKPLEIKAPFYYAVLPILPILLLIVFSDFIQLFPSPIVLDTTTVMFISLAVAILFEGIQKRQFAALMNSLSEFWKGMADIFKTVVTLIISAEFFAQGLIALGFIDGLIDLTQHLGFSSVIIGFIMTIMIYLSSMMMGSGNAAFFSFGPLVPGMAAQIGFNTTTLMLPMQLAASMGRAISPVSGVLIASAEIAGVSSMQIVKRNLIPLTTTLLVMLLFHFI
jgi:DcuC family C4-dicarboxylate transporter